MLINLDKEQEQQVEQAIKQFRGRLSVIEMSVGALVIGQRYGWRVLKLVHSPMTIKKYEKVLGLKFTEVCPERTELTHKSVGLAIADKLGSFWAVATGKKKVKGKDEIGNKEDEDNEL
jgi:hypothetical protein